jgi:hypothetical protein
MPECPPTVGERYVRSIAPDAGRVVTVTRVWVADDGHTAVAYEWRDDKPGQCFSACPLEVFRRTYRAELVDEEAALFEELWSMEYRITGDKPKAQAFAREFLNRHAHALAERARRQTARRNFIRPEYADAWDSGLHRGADEIDPEVTE